MTNTYYQIGMLAAFEKVGIDTGRFLRPALAGSLFGSATGALTAPEGHRGEGAMQGALYGGLGAGAGSAIGQTTSALGTSRAQKRLNRVQSVKAKAKQRAVNRPDSPMLGQYGAYSDSARAKTINRLEEAALADLAAKQKAQKTRGTGAAMLGGVLGAGTGTALTERNARMTAEQDPYGYRYQYPPMR